MLPEALSVIDKYFNPLADALAALTALADRQDPNAHAPLAIDETLNKLGIGAGAADTSIVVDEARFIAHTRRVNPNAQIPVEGQVVIRLWISIAARMDEAKVVNDDAPRRKVLCREEPMLAVRRVAWGFMYALYFDQSFRQSRRAGRRRRRRR